MKKFTLLLLLSFLGDILFAQNITETLEKKLETYIARLMEAYEIPGLAVGIVKDNRVIYTNGFGVRNLTTREPVTPKSLFHMASVSKPFSATAIMQLVEKGKVSLDDKVIKYLPYFKVDDEQFKEITIRQMLAHISGMPDVHDYNWDKPEYDVGAAERYVRSLEKEKLIGRPGEKFSYSNMAFEVLGDLIAKVSGKSFENYIKENILNPLEMKNSTFLKKEVPSELATTPHVNRIKPQVSETYPYHRAHAPSSTLHSNILEMCNWAIANMNKGVYKGGKILEPSSYEILWTPTKNKAGTDVPVGLSWFIGKNSEGRTIYHGGGDLGYGSYLFMMPEKYFALVILSNCDFAPIGFVSKAIMDLMSGMETAPIKIPITVPVGKTIAEKDITSAVKQFNELKEKQSSIYIVNERMINSLGYQLLQMNKVNDAIEIFKLNVKEFPNSANVYDSLGEAYAKLGNKDLAIENYEISLKLNPNSQSSIKALKQLRENK